MTIFIFVSTLNSKFFVFRNDPRFPTVRGIVRRGMTIEGLKEFIIAQVRYAMHSLLPFSPCSAFYTLHLK